MTQMDQLTGVLRNRIPGPHAEGASTAPFHLVEWPWLDSLSR